MILALAIVGPILCLARAPAGPCGCSGWWRCVSLAAYLITPETAAGPGRRPGRIRVQPALRRAGAGAVLRGPAARAGRSTARAARRPLIVALAVVLLATVTKASLWPHRHVLGVALVAAALSAAGVALVAMRARAPARAARAIVAAALLLLAGAAAGYGWQRHYLRGRYQFNPGVSYLSHVWAFFRASTTRGSGVVGTFGGFFSYPLWGLGRLKPRAVRRRPRPARLVCARSPLARMARGDQRRALPTTSSRRRRATPGTPSA